MQTVMFALNDFFTEVPKKDKGTEAQYDATVALLKRLVLHIGYDQLGKHAFEQTLSALLDFLACEVHAREVVSLLALSDFALPRLVTLFPMCTSVKLYVCPEWFRVVWRLLCGGMA